MSINLLMLVFGVVVMFVINIVAFKKTRDFSNPVLLSSIFIVTPMLLALDKISYYQPEKYSTVTYYIMGVSVFSYLILSGLLIKRQKYSDVFVGLYFDKISHMYLKAIIVLYIVFVFSETLIITGDLFGIARVVVDNYNMHLNYVPVLTTVVKGMAFIAPASLVLLYRGTKDAKYLIFAILIAMAPFLKGARVGVLFSLVCILPFLPRKYFLIKLIPIYAGAILLLLILLSVVGDNRISMGGTKRYTIEDTLDIVHKKRKAQISATDKVKLWVSGYLPLSYAVLDSSIKRIDTRKEYSYGLSNIYFITSALQFDNLYPELFDKSVYLNSDIVKKGPFVAPTAFYFYYKDFGFYIFPIWIVITALFTVYAYNKSLRSAKWRVVYPFLMLNIMYVSIDSFLSNPFALYTLVILLFLASLVKINKVSPDQREGDYGKPVLGRIKDKSRKNG